MNVSNLSPFTVENPDRSLSPKTGMNRSHWLRAARHLLDGVFRHVENVQAPLTFPKIPGKSYPRPEDPAWRSNAMEWEALVRTLNVAAPLVMENPDLELHGIPVAAYYRSRIAAMFEPENPDRLPTLASLKNTVMVQMTCEFGGLCVLLLQYPGLEDLLFDEGSLPAFREAVSEYGHGRTGPQNWRFFNVMMLTWLKQSGQEVDQELYFDHLNEMMACHAGDGWYRDADAFDYYTPWVYHIYSVLWSRVWGNANDPERAAVFRKNATTFMRTYPRFFSREGHMLMWGRSICYRMAAASPLPTVVDLPDCGIDPGWARRIQSGNLLQFLSKPEFYENAVPALGFYGHCEAVLQSYSCSASPFWLGLTFGALALPEDSPYWRAVENDGAWDEWQVPVSAVALIGPGLHVVNRIPDGTTELRPGNVNRHPGGNYSRLSYHSRLLWEPEDPEAAVTAGSYTFKTLNPEEKAPESLKTYRYLGVKNDVLYRQARTEVQTFFIPPRVDLADVILPRGVLRIDRVRVCEGAEVRLGHYALPVGRRGFEQHRALVHGKPCVQVDADRGGLALTAVHGWDDLGLLEHGGFSADAGSPRSCVPYAIRSRPRVHHGTAIVISVCLQRFDETPWTEDELQPVASFRQGPGEQGVQWVELELRDGRALKIDFDAVDGSVS